jgi:hypothetical protein
MLFANIKRSIAGNDSGIILSAEPFVAIDASCWRGVARVPNYVEDQPLPRAVRSLAGGIVEISDTVCGICDGGSLAGRSPTT